MNVPVLHLLVHPLLGPASSLMSVCCFASDTWMTEILTRSAACCFTVILCGSTRRKCWFMFTGWGGGGGAGEGEQVIALRYSQMCSGVCVPHSAGASPFFCPPPSRADEALSMQRCVFPELMRCRITTCLPLSRLDALSIKALPPNFVYCSRSPFTRMLPFAWCIFCFPCVYRAPRPCFSSLPLPL